jgi:hypothetical protein
MSRYGRRSQKEVERTMREYKRGQLRSGKAGHKARSRKQAIAIGLSEARRKGAKVPPAPRRSASAGKTTHGRTSRRTTAA